MAFLVRGDWPPSRFSQPCLARLALVGILLQKLLHLKLAKELHSSQGPSPHLHRVEFRGEVWRNNCLITSILVTHRDSFSSFWEWAAIHRGGSSAAMFALCVFDLSWTEQEHMTQMSQSRSVFQELAPRASKLVSVTEPESWNTWRGYIPPKRETCLHPSCLEERKWSRNERKAEREREREYIDGSLVPESSIFLRAGWIPICDISWATLILRKNNLTFCIS